MFLAHSFRLRQPWQCECALDGATRWSRVFHRPTGLEDDDALWLVCSGLPAEALVTLNGQQLTPNIPHSAIRNPQTPSALQPPASSLQPPNPQQHSYEVTPLLADTNKIELLIPSDPSPVPRPPSSASLPSASEPPASSLQPPAFPFDIRLGVIGHS